MSKFMNFLTFNLSPLIKYDEKWCEKMNYFNPYLDPFEHKLSSKMPYGDYEAYNMYPKHNWVYDKLLIAQMQGLMAGKLEDLKNKNNINYPIFIKPRWGHKTGSSKNCFKIKTKEELQKHLNVDHMMWCEFIKEKEGMTDYFLLDGKIVHQVTYMYSNEQNGFSDVWKYISSENKPPHKITEWVTQNMTGYTGVVNAQYRGNIIIEIGLRLARGGAYITSTENKALIKNINNLIERKYWDYSSNKQMEIKPYYAFKCFTTSNILYLLPQHLVDLYVNRYNIKPFYEYYFEPVGNEGYTFFQFLHNDFNEGMELKENFERFFTLIQHLFIFMFIVTWFIFIKDRMYGTILIIILFFMFITKYLNPITTNHALYKAIKQNTSNEDPKGPDNL